MTLRLCFGLAAICMAGLAVQAKAGDSSDRQLVTIAAGTPLEIGGIAYSSAEGAQAILVVSSELQTLAVVSGTVAAAGLVARAGKALVSPIDRGTTRLYGYDAARLAATLPPDWPEIAAPLEALAAKERRRRFWGMVEPVGVNAAAPVAPQAEAFRRAYLGNGTVLALRREAKGDRQALAALTVRRFAEAVAASDAATIADLIDPKPFSDASPDPAVWLAARSAFARRLTSDGALARALAAPVTATPGTEGSFDAGGAFRIALVMRDRALFVAAVEPVS
jgi:hypothetical protein